MRKLSIGSGARGWLWLGVLACGGSGASGGAPDGGTGQPEAAPIDHDAGMTRHDSSMAGHDGSIAHQDAGAPETGSPADGHQSPHDASLTDRGGSADAGADVSWRPFDDTSPWNTAIAANAPLDSSSSTLIADFSSISGQTTLWINIQQYSVPVYWVGSTTPMQNVTASLGGTGFRTGASSDSVSAGTGMAPIPAGATPAAGTDRHLSIVDRTANTEWGFWNANDTDAGWTAGEASTLDLSGSGVRPPTNDSPWWAGQGPRACGFGLIAGLITEDDIESGAIRHALILAYPHIESRYYTPPASSAQGTTSEALPTRGIPCGGHVQLDPSLDVTTLGLSSAGLMIAHALQTYGAFIGDFSGAVSLYADESPTALAYWASGVLGNSAVSAIPLDKFQVLSMGMLYDNNN